MIAWINVLGALKISAGSDRPFMYLMAPGNVTGHHWALLYATPGMFYIVETVFCGGRGFLHLKR